MARQDPPKQMRITDETMEQIRAIAQEIGGTQQDVMTHLLQLHQAEQAKVTLPDRAKEIEQYRGYMDAATQMFLNVLQDAANIADATKTKYGSLIDTLQSQLSELRTKCSDAERAVATSKSAEDAAKAKVDDLEARVDELSTALADKARIIDGLERQIANMQADVEHAKLYAVEKEQQEQKICSLEEQVHQLTVTLENVKDEHAREMQKADLAHQQMMLNADSAFRAKMDEARNEFQKQLSQRQDEYQDLLHQMHVLTVSVMQGKIASVTPTGSDSDQSSLDDST